MSKPETKSEPIVRHLRMLYERLLCVPGVTKTTAVMFVFSLSAFVLLSSMYFAAEFGQIVGRTIYQLSH